MEIISVMQVAQTASISVEMQSFLQTWGSLILSAISLIIAAISLYRSSKAQKLQNEINRLELIIKKGELAELKKQELEANTSCVEARIVKMGRGQYRMKVWNSGKVTVTNVNAKFVEDTKIIMFDQEKMPFEELEPQKSFELGLLTYAGSSRKAKVQTEWNDSKGNYHSKQQIVDIQ